jgi:alginate O-acetyltransferase complex protein AlgI
LPELADLTLVFIIFFFIIEWLGRENKYALERFGLKWNRFVRLIIYYLIVFFLFWYSGEEKQFIYFQF